MRENARARAKKPPDVGVTGRLPELAEGSEETEDEVRCILLQPENAEVEKLDDEGDVGFGEEASVVVDDAAGVGNAELVLRGESIEDKDSGLLLDF